MANSIKEIFLASKEHRGDWGRVRRAAIVGRVTDTDGRDYLWIQVDPPVIGQPYDQGQQDIRDLLLRPHFEGDSLFPITRFPLPVYIFRVLSDAFTGEIMTPEALELAAWGEIYETKEDAEAVARSAADDES